MNHFYPLNVKKIRPEANDSVFITFDIPENLRGKFRFKQGQYLTLQHFHEGEDLRRSYSICNAPSNGNSELSLLVKHIEDGRVSSFLNKNLKEGDTMQVMQPMGMFQTTYHTTNQRTFIGLAAGSGISAVLSNIKESLYQEPNSNAYIFYGNKSFEDVLLKDELHALAAEFPERLQIVYLVSREKSEDPLFEGRISSEKLELLLERYSDIKPEESVFFICGPTEMIKGVSAYLKTDKKVPALQVLYEYFSNPDDGDNAEMSEEFKKIPNIESFVTLIIDDDEYSIHLNSKKESILDKALKDNLPVPFACKGGVCCTCKAQVLEGEVFMEKNFALTEEEVEKGYVLTCQCHPTTNIVMLNYDV